MSRSLADFLDATRWRYMERDYERACDVCGAQIPPAVTVFELFGCGERIATACRRCAYGYHIEREVQPEPWP